MTGEVRFSAHVANSRDTQPCHTDLAVYATDTSRPGSPRSDGIATEKPASMRRRPNAATFGVIPGSSWMTTTPGPVPPRKTGRVAPSNVNVVSLKPASASPDTVAEPTSEARELFAEEAEAHTAEVECVGVERLQVERRAVTAARVLPAVQPHALTDLVADRLTRPAQIPVDLAAHELLRHAAPLDDERQRELGRPPFAGVVALLRWNRELEVHPDVDDDAYRAHRLGREHSQLPCRVVQVAQLTHEALCIQRPSFAVARHPTEQPLEPRQLL